MSMSPRNIAALFLFTLVLLLGAPLRAQSADAGNASTEQIVQQVLEELESSGALKNAVRDGIHEFIREQQQAQAEALRQQQAQADTRADDVRPVSRERDHIYGNPDASISLIEYSDFECPYCKRFHPTARELVDASDGRINWVYRHFPLAMHNPGAQQQAEASECAAELGGNDAFWAYTNAVYARTSSGGNGFPEAKLVPLAGEIGLDEAGFRECLDSGRHAERVREDLEGGMRAGVNGTPGNILVNNETGEALMRAGAQPLEALRDAVAELRDGDQES